jgi:hypothetical protein
MPLHHAELWGNKSWNLIGIDTGLTMPKERRMRCPECHGKVWPHKEGTNAQKAHFEHDERNTGCSLGNCFDGTKRRHRKPME